MSEDLFKQEYKNEWKVYRGDSVYTPVFSPNSRLDIKIRFQIKVVPQKNGKGISEYFSILGYISGLNSEVKLEMFISLHYDADKKEILSCEKQISNESPIPIEFISAEIQIYKEDYHSIGMTDHSKIMTKSLGAMILKCRIITTGHLGTISSFHQLSNSLQNRSEFLQNFGSLYESQSCCDLKICIGEKTLSAHRFILATHSPVFKKMLEHDFLESKTNTIVISDFTFEVFEYFLKYMYTAEILDVPQEVVEELYTLADKYDVGVLRKECVRIMALDISVSNVCKIIKMAYDSDNQAIKSDLLSFIVQNFETLKSTSEWADLVDSHPRLGYEIVSKVHSFCHFP